MSSFLTLEDINGTIFNNQQYWWYVLDSKDIPRTDEFTDLTFDFLKISHSMLTETTHRFVIEVDNDLFTLAGGAVDTLYFNYDNNKWIINANRDFKLYLYMGPIKLSSYRPMIYRLVDDKIDLTLKELNTEQPVDILSMNSPSAVITDYNLLEKGYNEITHQITGGAAFCGYLYVNLIKSDFQFNCNQTLILGKMNTVKLGALSDYLPGGDMIGDNTPNITVEYKNQVIPVNFDETLNDYCFDLDLSDNSEIGTIDLKVFVEMNEVLNETTTKIRLSTEYETIDTLSKLTSLFTNGGGVGVLVDSIELTEDLVLLKNVLLTGNNETLDLNNHKIIVSEGLTFKADELTLVNGVNAIKQYTGSSVELTECTFSDCISDNGLGSCIQCDIDLDSLNNPSDFYTVLNECTFNNNHSCILHGGELIVNKCTVNGTIANKNYPFFLYQTDGDSSISQSTFHLDNEEQIDYDIEFNSCVFCCGETATINGLSHNNLQDNNVISFIERNNSTIHVTYYYSLIENYITLSSTRGYCHCVSGVDYVFKTNITLERS